MPEVWDLVEPANSHKSELCPQLWNSQDPKPFKRVFSNQQYVVLKV